MKSHIVVGTDTGIGKTVLSALLMSVDNELLYWKPIQSGMEEETDSQSVQRISECNSNRILPEGYKLQAPLSPHRSAALEGKVLSEEFLKVPTHAPLIIETAGGVLVPIAPSLLQIELIRSWNFPVIIATRTILGTINHTLLTIEALNNRNIPIAGIVSIGTINPDNEQAIEEYGNSPIIGRIPTLNTINASNLREVYNKYFLQEVLN